MIHFEVVDASDSSVVHKLIVSLCCECDGVSVMYWLSIKFLLFDLVSQAEKMRS